MNEPLEAWVVDDDASIRWVLEQALSEDGIRVRSFDNAAGARNALGNTSPDVLLADIRMPGEDGLKLLEYLQAQFPELPVIIMTAHSDLDSALSAYSGGAFDYLPKPFDVDAAVATVTRAVQARVPRQEHRGASAREQARVPLQQVSSAEIIGEAPAMQEVFRAVGRLRKSSVTVLISGESGTGKELIARALHRHSPRANGRLVTLNAAAIPPELIESELFGHERGAFTGAHVQRIGRFEEADGGTLFLDEIGDMPTAAQTRLLRVLEDGSFYRVGGSRPIHTDVRVLAATHQPLESLVEQGRFRDDLYHRLAVVHVHVPPLRERSGDLPVLFEHFLASAAREMGTAPKKPNREVFELLSQHRWPGNVRQLENLCQWLTVMVPGETICPGDLPREFTGGMESPGRPGWQAALAEWAEAELDRGEGGVAGRVQEAAERVLIETALKRAQGKKGEAAKLLGWGRNTLARKLK